MSEKEILEGLTKAVVAGDGEACIKYSHEVLKAGIDPYKALMEGCAKGMEEMSKRYDNGEAFVPEILLSADAMSQAIDILKPHIKVDKSKVPGKVVIGVMEGDVHDIGKNIVRILLEVAGYTVIDMGRDVPMNQFVETIRDEKPDIVALSALMTTSMMGMPELMDLLTQARLRADVSVIIGGGPVTTEFAEKIGADGYGANAPEAVRVCDKIMQAKRGVA
ncbi:MAG: corrinoid protein [Candidatus Methanosuratus sp.]|nr:corrinoid protein [Candidatus Methanosuratincola sp.]